MSATDSLVTPLRAFACRVRGCDHETVINSTSIGRAKREFLINLDIDGIEFTDIRVRRLGAPVTTDDLRRIAEYRGVPFARAGMLVQVGGDRGRIIGHNSSANFDVLFEEGRWAGQVLSCHPLSEIVYLNDVGEVLADFRKQRHHGDSDNERPAE